MIIYTHPMIMWCKSAHIVHYDTRMHTRIHTYAYMHCDLNQDMLLDASRLFCGRSTYPKVRVVCLGVNTHTRSHTKTHTCVLGMYFLLSSAYGCVCLCVSVSVFVSHSLSPSLTQTGQCFSPNMTKNVPRNSCLLQDYVWCILFNMNVS